MEISTEAALRRSYFKQPSRPRVNPKYAKVFDPSDSSNLTPKQRLDSNSHQIEVLHGKINNKINGSYFFTPGKQELDSRFQELFVNFFREMRSGERLVSDASYSLAEKCVFYSDISYTSTQVQSNGGLRSRNMPTTKIIIELREVIEQEYGLGRQFLKALDENGKRFEDNAKLEDPDLFIANLPSTHDYRQKSWTLQTWPIYLPLSGIAKLFPRCSSTLKDIFEHLLASEWLQKDIDGVKLYLNRNYRIDRPIQTDEQILEVIEMIKTWIIAKDYGDKQKKRDVELDKKYWNNLKDDTLQTLFSGGLSLATGNPAFVVGQSAKTVMNQVAHDMDPEGTDKTVKVLKLLGGAGVGGALGGKPWELATSLGVDLLDLGTRTEKTGKKESALRNLGGSVLKGALTNDKKKLLSHILGGVVAETANQLPETSETTSLKQRIARALLTNPDIQSHYVNKYINECFKEGKKPIFTSQLSEEEQAKYPEQVLGDGEVKKPEVHVTIEDGSQQDRSHLLDTPPQDLPIYYSLDKDDKNDYRIYLYHEGKTPKAVGRFYSEGKAVEAVTALNDHLRQVNTLNAESYGDQQLYESLGLNPNDLANTLQFEPIYPAINAPGDKSKAKVYLGGERILKTSDYDKAFKTLKTLLSDDIAAKTQERAAYKAEMDAKAPSHILPPKGTVQAPFDNKGSKYHQLSYIDDSGRTQSLGKYASSEDAKRISSAWVNFQTTTLSQKERFFDVQKQLLAQGYSIEDVPNPPQLETPVLDGKNADKSYQKIQESRIRNEKVVREYIKNAEQLVGEPIVAQGISKAQVREISEKITPRIKDDPKEHGLFYNAYRAPGKGLRWLDNHGVSLSVNVNLSTPLYKTKAPNSTPSHAGVYGPDMPKENPIVEKPSFGGWEAVQQMQQQKIFNANMERPVAPNTQQEVPIPQPSAMDYKDFWGQGVAKDVQAPPTNFNNLGKNQPSNSALQEGSNRQMQTAGVHGNVSLVAAKLTRGLFSMFLPDMSDMPGAENPMDHINRIVTPEATGDFIKSMPKGLPLMVKGVVSLMLPDMSDVPGAEDPKQHFNRVFHNTMKKYDQIVQIQNSDGLAAKSGMFVGEMFALGGVSKVIRVAEGVSVFGMACEGGFIGAVMSEAHETNVVAGVALGFIGGGVTGKLLFRGGGKSQPLIDRALIKPEGFGRQARVMRQIEGYVDEKGLPTKFVAEAWGKRNTHTIAPLKLPSLQQGGDLNWFVENRPKIDHFRNIHPSDPKKFYLAVRREFAPQNLSELQIRRILDYTGFNTYASPEGLPSNVVLEFSKKNGGMSYRCPGTTTDHNLVVRVCPGLAEESIVSSVHKGNHLNGKMPGTLRQQYPYVVQRKGKFTLTRDGEWIDLNLPCNKGKEALTHIRLEEYQFKGWE